MVSGRATAQGTAGYFNSRKELGGWLESAGLHCSSVGFGSYRVDDVTPTHAEALKTALLSGCNLIDTSTNYTDGRSEKLIGKALAELIKVGVLDRDQVIVVSKVGYVQGQALALAASREAARTPFSEMVKYQEGCWHCIHPDFLRVQLEKSLSRLALECVDFYLLHNPEYFFMDAIHRGRTDVAKLREEFYDRVHRAFEFLETEASKGTIQGYGVSSNTFGAAHDDETATSVSRMWEIANSLSSNHHFRIIQLPMNLFEHGPYTEKNTGEKNSLTALEFARKHHLAVLANRPLNAFAQNQLIRLADNISRTSDGISAELNPFLPEAWQKKTLSQKAIGVLIHTPGVSCVLNGMRTPDYVHDSMDAARLVRLDEEKLPALYGAFS